MKDVLIEQLQPVYTVSAGLVGLSRRASILLAFDVCNTRVPPLIL
jgi:hypothetical protein